MHADNLLDKLSRLRALIGQETKTTPPVAPGLTNFIQHCKDGRYDKDTDIAYVVYSDVLDAAEYAYLNAALSAFNARKERLGSASITVVHKFDNSTIADYDSTNDHLWVDSESFTQEPETTEQPMDTSRWKLRTGLSAWENFVQAAKTMEAISNVTYTIKSDGAPPKSYKTIADVITAGLQIRFMWAHQNAHIIAHANIPGLQNLCYACPDHAIYFKTPKEDEAPKVSLLGFFNGAMNKNLTEFFNIINEHRKKGNLEMSVSDNTTGTPGFYFSTNLNDIIKTVNARVERGDSVFVRLYIPGEGCIGYDVQREVIFKEPEVDEAKTGDMKFYGSVTVVQALETFLDARDRVRMLHNLKPMAPIADSAIEAATKDLEAARKVLEKLYGHTN